MDVCSDQNHQRQVNVESKHYYAIRVTDNGYPHPPYLARQNASAPALFWFHEDALKHLNECGGGCDIVKVLVTWDHTSKTYNTPEICSGRGRNLRSLKVVVDRLNRRR